MRANNAYPGWYAREITEVEETDLEGKIITIRYYDGDI